MQNSYKIPLTLLLFMFCLGTTSAQIIVKFTKTEISTQELTQETIVLPIAISGTFPDDLDKFTIKVELGGDASETFDYTIDSRELDILKGKLDIPPVKITIKNDQQSDDREELRVSLKVADDGVTVDPAAGTLVIKIRDQDLVSQEVLRRVNADKDTSEAVGILSLNLKHPPLYTLRETTLDSSQEDKKISSENQDLTLNKAVQSVKIYKPSDSKKGVYEFKLTYLQVHVTKVELAIFNGVISDLKVYADIYKQDPVTCVFKKAVSEIFANIVARGDTIIDSAVPSSKLVIKKRIPISVRHLIYDSRIAETKLYAVGKALGRYRNDFIKFGELLWYDASLARNYPPGDNASIVLKPEPGKDQIQLTTKTSLRSYINLNIYTDFLSLVKAEKGNGLVQTEASAHIFLQTKNLFNTYSYIFNYLEPYLKYSRFDSGFNSVNPDTLANGDVRINRTMLYQRSFLNLGLRLNLLRWITKFNNDLEWNALTQFDWANTRGKALTRSNPSDALEYEQNRINMLAFATEVKYRTILYRNFGLTSGWRTSIQKLWNNPDFVNKKGTWYHSPEFELFYYPIAESDDRVFFRFRTILTTNSAERHFAQLQIGYKGQFNFNSR